MNASQLRQKIDSQLSLLSPGWLVVISNFLKLVQVFAGKSQTLPVTPMTVIKRDRCAQDLLKYANTWQGDDLEACLEEVKQTRSQAEF